MDNSFATRKFSRSIAGFSLLAILASLFSFAGTALASTFDDVASSSWAYDYVDSLSDAEVMTGYADGTFGPDDNLTREQAAKILVLAFAEVDDSASVTCSGDVSSWATSYMATANMLGILEGDDEGNCNAMDEVNRAEFAKMVVSAAGLSSDGTMASDYFSDVDAGAWYDEYMGTAYVYSIMSGYDNGKMGPSDSVTRAQAAKMTYMGMNPEYMPPDEPTEPGTPSSEATIMVELSNDSPDSTTIADEATAVDVAAWDFTAEGDDAVLKALTVNQYGISTLSSSHEVYLYDGSERISSGVSVNSTTNDAVFNNLSLDLPEGETVTLTLRLNVGNMENTGEAGFEIESADMVSTNADVEGDFPVRADKHSLSTTAVGTVTIEKNGTVSNANVGDKEATVAKFTLSAGTDSLAVQELGLYLSGSISTSEVNNFMLYRTGESDPIATAEAVDGRDVVRFVLDDSYDNDASTCGTYEGYCLENGSSRTFQVKADFNTGRSSDTVKVYVDENVDIFAVDTKYGFGASVTSTDYDGTSCTTSGGDCSYSELQGGDITMTRHSISNTNAAVNQNDVMILDFTISTETDVTFNNFVLKLAADESASASGLVNASDASNFTDIRVKALDGSFTWGPIDADQLKDAVGGTAIDDSSDTTGYYTFTDDLSMDAGDSMEFGVFMDIEDNSSLNEDGITASVYIGSSYPEIKDSNNKVVTNSSSLVPTSTFAGDEFTIKANSLDVALYSGVGSATQVIGTDDAVLAAFSMTAGDANALTLTSLDITGYYDTNSSGTFTTGGTFSSVVTNLGLYAGSVNSSNLLDTAGATSSGLIDFKDFDYDIEAGTTVVFYVTGTIANNSSYDDYRVKVDIADVSADIDAEDESGSTVTSSSSDTPNGGTADTNTIVTVSAGGTLAVSIPSSIPNSQIVVAGTTGNEFAQIRLTATDESFEVYKLALKNNYSSTVGDYDDNISSITLDYYTDIAQTTQSSVTCSSTSTSGVYKCNFPSSAPLMVPDSSLAGVPDYSVVTVEVALNSTASDLADEGDQPGLTLSLSSDFEARGVESNKLIEESGAYDLAITNATSSYSDAATGYDDVQLQAAISSATATSITLDDGTTDPGDANLVGAFLCFDEDADSTCDSSEEQVYVTAVTDGASSDTVTVVRGVNGTSGDSSVAIDTGVLVLLPSTVLATNYMQVQATDVDLAVSSSSRTGSQSATETIMTFTATANDAKNALVRAALGNGDTGYGEEYSTPTALTAGPSSVTRVSSTPTPVEGTYAVKILDAAALAAGDGGSLDAGSVGLLDDYSYASLWVYINDDETNDDPVAGTGLLLGTGTTATAFQQTSEIGSSSTIAEETWVFFNDIAIPSGTDSSDRSFGIKLDTGMTDAADYVAFDDVRFYNERINVDLTLNENWAAVTHTVAYLVQDSRTVAVGYLDTDGIVSSKTGQILFVPSGTYGEIEMAGDSTFQVKMDTSTAITNDSDATEQLTARIDEGNVSTNGDFWWYDGEDTLKFLGINSTDKIQVTTSY